ncbi:sulfite exporter TauE/SafE family protein 3-like [Olea europaea var. sylvestris]|uniref:sulfite exporter TauE/SafE family protein 3-like n=1 Tax=Olea europaea var. sylvestris TaxID=158386 RepID=UPI000C1D82D2|nr:sulfite exporter TauE/SafE family protein 3-like [Olea europaea var. sylvestris]
MAGNQEKWRAFRPLLTVVWSFLLASIFVSAERRSSKQRFLSNNANGFAHSDSYSDVLKNCLNFIWQANKSGYQHVWPDLKFNWQIVVGSIIGFLGAAFGSVGGVGGGGIYVPMLTLIIGFDPKSATAISKCMIMGAAVSTVYYNLKLRHPTIDMPIIDYDLAVLIQPMLMLGISIGVAFNVIFADWMVTILLIVLFIGTSTKSFFRGVETWKKETIMKKVITSTFLRSWWHYGLVIKNRPKYKKDAPLPFAAYTKKYSHWLSPSTKQQQEAKPYRAQSMSRKSLNTHKVCGAFRITLEF